MTPRPYRCSGCDQLKPRSDFHEAAARDRTRDVYSRCKECRRERYFSKRYATVCIQCLKHRPLNKNSICPDCNDESGLRECRGPCGLLLPLFLEFYGSRRTCKKCSLVSRRGREFDLGLGGIGS